MIDIKAEIIVLQIIDDLQHRAGIGDIWFAIDKSVQEEIKRDWIEMTKQELERK